MKLTFENTKMATAIGSVPEIEKLTREVATIAESEIQASNSPYLYLYTEFVLDGDRYVVLYRQLRRDSEQIQFGTEDELYLVHDGVDLLHADFPDGYTPHVVKRLMTDDANDAHYGWEVDEILCDMLNEAFMDRFYHELGEAEERILREVAGRTV